MDKVVQNIKQFISYFFVGGVAAIVEWITFFFFLNILQLHYLLSTVFAFIFSTTTNWVLGRKFTFKNSAYKKEKSKEMILIFLVSAVGLVFNIVLMYIFVSVLFWNTEIMKVLSKIVATGIVFIWNFLIRKFFIYKER